MNSDFARAAVADTDLAMNFVAASTVYGSSASTISSSSTSFTVEAWAKSTDTCSSSAIVAGFEATWVIFCNGGYWAISMYTSNWQTTNSAYKVVAGEWVHLALTRNSSGNYVFYINGQIALSGTLAGVASNTAKTPDRKLGIKMVFGLGDKIQSSSWLLKDKK